MTRAYPSLLRERQLEYCIVHGNNVAFLLTFAYRSSEVIQGWDVKLSYAEARPDDETHLVEIVWLQRNP